MSLITSESVWFEQVDIALISYIQNIVKLTSSSGELVPVPVKIRKPDEDFKIEEYPSVSLYNLYSRRDEVRYFPDMTVVDRNIETNKLIEEKSAVPYTLYYQFDFWSRLQSDMNDMLRIWLGNHPDRNFNLPVLDMSGNSRSCNVLLSDDLKKADFLNSNDRTFHSVLTYKIWVEIDERIRRESDLITGVIDPTINKI